MVAHGCNPSTLEAGAEADTYQWVGGQPALENEV